MIWGRGAADMKSGVAAFAAAAIDFVAATPPAGSIALLITGDEEAEAVDGTVAILDWMAANGERLDHCLVGEPTSAERTGDAIKIGRRGSLTARLTAYGVQGHAAYPEKARNPLPALVRLLDRLAAHRLDGGTAHFGPSTLALTTIDVGNPASNVIPAEARATLNIRFNDAHSGASLSKWIEEEADRVAAEFKIGIAARIEISGESFLTAPGPFTALVARAVEAETGLSPALSTTGGTSDARFVKDHCPVVEVGLHGPTMHHVDEHVAVADIETLRRVYARILADYFAAGGLRG
jgi:succinyl-diaminopimelate desuccinylase